MQKYRRKRIGEPVEMIRCPGGVRSAVCDTGKPSCVTMRLNKRGTVVFDRYDADDFDREYERVEEKGEASIEHRFYCTQCYKDCDGLTEACHIAGRVGVVCPDCLSLHRDREAEVAAALHKQRARCEWERTHKGEWAKGPKDWWCLCADCDQPIPPSSDWLWKHGMCGSRICEACGKKRQAQGKHGIVYICQACGAKLYDGLKDVVMHKGRNLCQSCYRRIIERERVKEKKKSLLLCAACGKSLDYGEAYGRENGTGVFCAECWGVAQVKVASEAFRAKCEWERTHEGEWGKKPKPFNYERHSYGFHACYICARCGKAIDEDDGFSVSGSLHKHGDGRHREAICVDCWNTTQRQIVVETRGQVEEEAKKPAPLTLADLEPGDVFKIVGGFGPERTCQHMGESTRDPRYWAVFYQDGGDGMPYVSESIWQKERDPCVQMEFIRHHNLTPKELLWVAAKPEERKALDDSIRDKWLPIMRGEKQGQRAEDCPLCHIAHECQECMIGKATKQDSCHGTPWCRVAERGDYSFARAFTLWLAEFLPNIDPTRIEVEATPEEWPGGK